MTYKKIDLPYGYMELEPWIDAKTVEIHYGKHLQTYVEKLNAIVDGNRAFFKDKTIEDVLKDVDDIPSTIRQGVVNQGGGVANHNFYFAMMSPNAKTEPTGKLLKAIEDNFNSFEEMKSKMTLAAINQFGSGWAWLVMNKENELEILQSLNQDSPLSLGKIPLITIDVWEHAYYLKYQNLRAEYVKNIWNLIDFERAEKIYEENINEWFTE